MKELANINSRDENVKRFSKFIDILNFLLIYIIVPGIIASSDDDIHIEFNISLIYWWYTNTNNRCMIYFKEIESSCTTQSMRDANDRIKMTIDSFLDN